MKKKLVSMLCCTVMAVSMLAGCGNSSETQEKPDQSAQTADSSAKETTVTEEAVDQGSTETMDDIRGCMKGVKVRIGTSGTFGPFSYYDTDGTTLIGYDLDMLYALQDILGFDIDGDIQAMDYSALTASVTEGKLDVVAAGLCVTDERKEVMNFTDSYAESSLSVVVNKDTNTDITGVESLSGKTVAVEKGTEAHMYAQQNLTDSDLQVFDNITIAYEALEQGKVDALIELTSGCAFYLKTAENSKLEIVGDEFDKGETTYAIALNKDFDYLDEFNAALNMLKEDGTMDKLYSTWCE